MEKIKRQPVGNLKVSQEVIATIANVAAMEVDGVDSLVEPGRNLALFSKKMGKNGVSIELSDDFAEINLSLNLKFGAPIPEVCARVQSNVKDNIQTMTGLAVSKVNITVAGIVFPPADGESA